MEFIAEKQDDIVSSDLLQRFMFDGRRIPLVDRQHGIRKPALLDAALSIRTTFTPPGKSPLGLAQLVATRSAIFVDALVTIEWLTVFWATTGCSLRIAVPNRNPLSVGWIFPPGQPRWMGLTDVILGWHEDANGLALTDSSRAALEDYSARIAGIVGASP